MHFQISARHLQAPSLHLPFPSPSPSPSPFSKPPPTFPSIHLPPPPQARDATSRMSACVEKEGAHTCVRKLFRDMPDLCGSFYAYFIHVCCESAATFQPSPSSFLLSLSPLLFSFPILPPLSPFSDFPLPDPTPIIPPLSLFPPPLFVTGSSDSTHRPSTDSTPSTHRPSLSPDWFRSFHPQAFLFLRFEDYMANPRPHIAQTLDFLGFPAADVAEEQWAGIVDLERVEQRPEGMAREELDGVTRDHLEAFFAPFNADLVRLLRHEKYSWKRGQRL
ncbi:unnamed protein product [Closterium sp. Naga37s-1]|nr:unnamed protein product [Closterium sp. Naga37s-1]